MRSLTISIPKELSHVDDFTLSSIIEMNLLMISKLSLNNHPNQSTQENINKKTEDIIAVDNEQTIKKDVELVDVSDDFGDL